MPVNLGRRGHRGAESGWLLSKNTLRTHSAYQNASFSTIRQYNTHYIKRLISTCCTDSKPHGRPQAYSPSFRELRMFNAAKEPGFRDLAFEFARLGPYRPPHSKPRFVRPRRQGRTVQSGGRPTRGPPRGRLMWLRTDNRGSDGCLSTSDGRHAYPGRHFPVRRWSARKCGGATWRIQRPSHPSIQCRFTRQQGC